MLLSYTVVIFRKIYMFDNNHCSVAAIKSIFFWFADIAYLNFDLNRPFILNLHKVDQPFQDEW